jgi:hypothetical protein
VARDPRSAAIGALVAGGSLPRPTLPRNRSARCLFCGQTQTNDSRRRSFQRDCFVAALLATTTLAVSLRAQRSNSGVAASGPSVRLTPLAGCRKSLPQFASSPRIEQNLPKDMGQRDLASLIRLRSTEPIRAGGQAPRRQAGHMTASDLLCRNGQNPRQRGHPHLSSGRPISGPVGRCDEVLAVICQNCSTSPDFSHYLDDLWEWRDCSRWLQPRRIATSASSGGPMHLSV